MNIIIFLVISSNVFSQEDIHEANSACIKSNNISFEKRLTNFPFKQSQQVKLVAFKNKNPQDIPGSELQVYLDDIKIGITQFNENHFNEVATLENAEIDALTDIIYNYSYKAKPYATYGATCYEPRNAIIFLDEKSRVVAFLELCFGCDHFRSSHKKLDLGKYCVEKFDLLKKLFAKKDIKFGITEE